MAKRDFRGITDISSDEVIELFNLTTTLKHDLKEYNFKYSLKNRVAAMIFEKPSLRTRVTFETGMFQLGGHAIYLAPADIGLGKRETVYDGAKNLERWVDLIVARTFSHKTVDDLAQYAEIPVINALSDLEHPCQAMADFFTLYEKRGTLEHLTFAYIGDGNNICNSLLLLSGLTGVNINVANPSGYETPDEILDSSKRLAASHGSRITFFDAPEDAVKDVEAIYTDVWASMGQEDEKEERKKVFAPYQVNQELVSKAPENVLIMHDLPARRGEEITDEIIDSPNSIVFDQAENRLHIQKAIMIFLLSN